jgi:WD40 repeat protein
MGRTLNGRRRGVVLTPAGLNKLNVARQNAEQQDNNGDRYTLEDLSDRTQLSIKTITKVLHAEIPVDKQTLDTCFRAFNLTLERSDYHQPVEFGTSVNRIASTSPSSEPSGNWVGDYHVDWGEAPDVCHFYGRQEELKTLTGWIQEDACRLISILGMGGMGKTTLSVKLTQQFVPGRSVPEELCPAFTHDPGFPFQFIIWRSLRNAPSLDTLLSDWISILSHQQETQTDLRRLLYYLQQHRCLLVLDNLETLLDTGQAGSYRPGYEPYSELLRLVGSSPHQSCLLLTSREKVWDVVPFAGDITPVRCLALQGSPETAQVLLRASHLTGTEKQRQQLCDRYSNNPLAIQLIAATIRDLFDSDIGTFLNQNVLLLGGLRRLLDQHFERLSPLEESIMIWLAINRDWTSLSMLLDDMTVTTSRTQLLDALESLRWRSLIEKQQNTYTQQPVVMEYVTERLTEQVSTELLSPTSEDSIPLTPAAYLNRYALLKTTLKDYIRVTQSRLILDPICRQLQASLGSRHAVIEYLKHRLAQYRVSVGFDAPTMDHPPPMADESYGPGNLLNLLCHLNADLTGLDVSGLTIWHAYLPGVPLPNTNFSHTHLHHTVFSNVFSAVFSIAFRPDGNQFATGEIGGFVRLWDLASGQICWGLKGHRSWIWSLAFSPDGQMLATGTGDQVIGLWDVQTGQCLHTLSGHTDQIYAVAFSPCGNYLASASGDGTVRLWQIKSQECVQTIQAHINKVWTVQFSVCGHYIVSGGGDRQIKIWSVPTGALVHTFIAHQDHVHSIAFHPEGHLLASASADNTIKLWSLRDRQLVKTLPGHTMHVLSLSFSPDGKTLASSSSDHTVRLWDIHTGQTLRILREHLNWIRSVHFSPDGTSLLSGSSDYSVRLWDVASGQVIKTWRGYSNWIWAAEFSADGRTLLSGSGDHTISLWDVQTGILKKTLRGHKTWVLAVSFSQDGSLMASAGSNDIHLWQLSSGRVINTLKGHTSQVASLQFSPTEQRLVSGSSDYTVRVWDISTGQVTQVWEGHTDWIRTVVFSADGRQVASASHDKTARLWDVETGECLHCFDGFDAWVWSVDFHPTQPILAIASGPVLTLWDLHTYTLIETYTKHQSWIRSVRFSPDGTRLATGGQDGYIYIWNIVTGQSVAIQAESHSHVLSVRFSPNGHQLASTSSYETIKIWDLASGTCVHSLKADGLCEGMVITGIQGLSPGAIATLRELGAIG